MAIFKLYTLHENISQTVSNTSMGIINHQQEIA